MDEKGKRKEVVVERERERQNRLAIDGAQKGKTRRRMRRAVK
jgi:hypothetical protein